VCIPLEGGSFVRKANGDVTTVDIPGASSADAVGINNRGAVVGSYLDADGVSHTYLMDRSGVTTIDPPGSPDDPDAANVFVADVNDRGQVVGCYADANRTYHGFRYDKGRFTRIDPPGAADVPKYATTCAFGINNRGQIVGQYVDAASTLHGYLWQPGRGFKTIDLPRGAQLVRPAGDRGTIAADINAAARSFCRSREASSRDGPRTSKAERRRPSPTMRSVSGATSRRWRGRAPCARTTWRAPLACGGPSCGRSCRGSC
jgi:probable HAF family extracellular repeat protein